MECKMPFDLKKAPSEFQNIMNKIFNPYTRFALIHIDDVLIFFNSFEEHFSHLKTFKQVIRENGLLVSATKIKLFQTKVRFLGFEIFPNKMTLIQRSIEFASKFPDKIADRNNYKVFRMFELCYRLY